MKKSFIKDQNYNIKIKGNNITAANIIDTWFNTEFFHCGEDHQKEERLNLLEAVEHEGNQNILFWCIIRTHHAIKSLYACTKDLIKKENMSINCPDERII